MRCYVCGANVEDGANCVDCGTVAALQARLTAQAARQRFLFGRIRPDEVELQRQPPPMPRREARARRAPKPKAEVPVVPARDFSLPTQPDPDLIRARDHEPVEPEPPMAAPDLAHRLVPHTLDVLTCLVLNLLVLQTVLLISGRSFQPLVVYSLVLGKSLGRLLFETWWAES